jgi:hypothetical protein
MRLERSPFVCIGRTTRGGFSFHLRLHQAETLVSLLEGDAIFDAPAGARSSNLQSENVQERWNWTANSYQKR